MGFPWVSYVFSHGFPMVSQPQHGTPPSRPTQRRTRLLGDGHRLHHVVQGHGGHVAGLAGQAPEPLPAAHPGKRGENPRKPHGKMWMSMGWYELVYLN